MVENLKLNSDLCVEAGGIIFETDDDNVSIFSPPYSDQRDCVVAAIWTKCCREKKHCVL